MESKYQCKECNRMLYESEYYIDNQNESGHKTVCKDCIRKRYLLTRDQKLDYQKQYNKDNEDRYKIYQKEYHAKLNQKKKFYGTDLIKIIS